MKQKLLLLGFLMIPGLLFTGAFLVSGQVALVIVSILLCTLQASIFIKNPVGAGSLLLFANTILAAVLCWQHGSILLAGAALLISLNGWDLIRFLTKLADVSEVIDENHIQKTHIQNLLWVDLSATVILLAVRVIQFQINFWWLFGLSILLILAITQFVHITGAPSRR
jgi:hypothetical protein